MHSLEPGIFFPVILIIIFYLHCPKKAASFIFFAWFHKRAVVSFSCLFTSVLLIWHPITLGSVPLTRPSQKKAKKKKKKERNKIPRCLVVTRVAKILYTDSQRGVKGCLGVCDMQCSLKNGGFPGGSLVKNSPANTRERDLQDIQLGSKNRSKILHFKTSRRLARGHSLDEWACPHWGRVEVLGNYRIGTLMQELHRYTYPSPLTWDSTTLASVWIFRRGIS